MRVGLTHSRRALPGLDARLAAGGLAVEWQPLVATAPRDRDALAAAALRLAGSEWLVFPSRSAVDAWFGHALPALRAARSGDEAVGRLARGRRAGGPALAATGAGTAAELSAWGRAADLVGGGDARSTALALLAVTGPGERVGLVQGDLARPTLRSLLAGAGREVVAATVYGTITRPWAGEPADVTVFASPSAVRAFGAASLRRTRPVAIGDVTLSALARLGAGAVVARRADVEGVAAAVEAALAVSNAGAVVCPVGAERGEVSP